VTTRSRAWHSVALTVAVVVALGMAVNQAPGSNPGTLEERAVAIDHVMTEPDGARVVIGHVSRRLHVGSDTLKDQQTQTGLGWGELLVAHLIAKMAAIEFDQVVGEYRAGTDWEGIARAHRVNLEKLDADVAQSQEIVEQREEDRAPATTSSPSGSSSSSGASHAPTTNQGGGKGRHRGTTSE
jgi:hypothetical protein